ncbi:hypothetical protein ABTJ00_16520, partial [Acinetobacter baumannii]
MKSIDEIKAQEVCVAILLDKKATNTQAKILPSENIIIDRLLERKVELQHVIYAELSGDFPLGDSRQPTYKSLRPF